MYWWLCLVAVAGGVVAYWRNLASIPYVRNKHTNGTRRRRIHGPAPFLLYTYTIQYFVSGYEYFIFMFVDYVLCLQRTVYVCVCVFIVRYLVKRICACLREYVLCWCCWWLFIVCNRSLFCDTRIFKFAYIPNTNKSFGK